MENRNTHQAYVGYRAGEKVLRGRATLDLGGCMMRARTDRIAASGVSLMVPRHTREEEPCVVSLDVLVSGALRRVNASGRVVSCSCVGVDGFRVTIRFTD